MKRCRRIFWILAAVILVSYGAVWLCLLKDSGKVRLEETVRKGNPGAVRDVAFTMPVSYKEKLKWESTIRPGGEAFGWCKPNYRGTAPYEKKSEQMRVYPFMRMDFEQKGEFTSDEAAQKIWQKIVEDVASRASAGQEYTESVKLADWFDSYPLTVNVVLSPDDQKTMDAQQKSIQNELEQQLKECFCFPVYPQEKVEVTVAKDQNGKIIKQDIRENDEFAYFYEEFASVPERYWFVPIAKDPNGNLLDYRCVPDGYGVYWINTENKAEPRFEKKLDLESDEMVLDMCSDRGMKRILILTIQKSGAQRLLVMDASTGEKIQEIELSQQGYSKITAGEDWVVLINYPSSEEEDAYFTLLLWKEKEYQIHYTVKDETGLVKQNYRINFQLAPDRERLAAASQMKVDSMDSCSFLAVVYNQTGEVYAAQFKSSIDCARPQEKRYWELCNVDHQAVERPGDVPPMIQWDE